MLRIGVTGGLGSGKSALTEYFRRRGAQIFDADMESKLILLRSKEVQQEVISTFGDAVLNAVGEIDFRRLAEEAFRNPKRQQALNAILHPAVINAADQTMAKAAASGVELFVVDAALLFEAGMDRHLDVTIVITAETELRVQRAIDRGFLTDKDIRRRITLQMADDERAARADYVIDNNGTLADLQARLDQLYDQLIDPKSS